MKRIGLFGATIPEEYGGLGLDLLTYVLIQIELSRGWMSLLGRAEHPFHLCLDDPDPRHGPAAERYLPRMATGELRFAYSMTEPHARLGRPGDPHPRNPRGRRAT